LESASDLNIELITSPANPRVKFAASLRDAKARRRENRFLIDGAQSISIAIAAGMECTEIFLSQEALDLPDDQIEKLLKLSEALGIRCRGLTEAPMQKIQYGQQDQQAIAVAIPSDTSLKTLLSRSNITVSPSSYELFLVLDRLEKPGNLGAAMRTADAAGATAVLLSDPTCDLWNPNAIRSSLGAIFTVPIASGAWSEIYSWLSERSVRCFAARTDGKEPYWGIRYPNKTAIVIGSEAHGLEDRWKKQEIHPIHIPMFGKIDSLNASITGSILLFEVIRQRPTH
jgi:TrmH family RNA methyltransferase